MNLALQCAVLAFDELLMVHGQVMDIIACQSFHKNLNFQAENVANY